ncbi:MAG: hypothetical protein Q7S21_01775 [archaeon]|nr:hypothetical protein [archaeon]
MTNIGEKSRFLSVYANLSLDLRKEIILIIEEGEEEKPITWNVAFNEISNETKLGKKILKKIIELELI